MAAGPAFLFRFDFVFHRLAVGLKRLYLPFLIVRLCLFDTRQR